MGISDEKDRVKISKRRLEQEGKYRYLGSVSNKDWNSSDEKVEVT